MLDVRGSGLSLLWTVAAAWVVVGQVYLQRARRDVDKFG